MTVDPSTAMLTAGTAAVITCAIGINDAVDPSDYSIDVEWLAPGGIQVSPGGRYMESEIQSVGSNSYVSKLSITPVVQSDNGLFRCAVTTKPIAYTIKSFECVFSAWAQLHKDTKKRGRTGDDDGCGLALLQYHASDRNDKPQCGFRGASGEAVFLDAPGLDNLHSSVLSSISRLCGGREGGREGGEEYVL